MVDECITYISYYLDVVNYMIWCFCVAVKMGYGVAVKFIYLPEKILWPHIRGKAWRLWGCRGAGRGVYPGDRDARAQGHHVAQRQGHQLQGSLSLCRSDPCQPGIVRNARLITFIQYPKPRTTHNIAKLKYV